jgi:hypothetical protein
MARTARRYRTRYSHSGRSEGLERALQHIEDAKRLSKELGGVDADVKRYFFSLDQARLSALLQEYGRAYGSSAQAYAEATMSKWQAGQVQMSGTVAERLFNLLPPRMPYSDKYRLTESLWRHVGPSSRRRLRVGLDAETSEVARLACAHLEEVVVGYRIPEPLERRFEWLSSGDVQVKQQLLNQLREQERGLLTEGLRSQVPLMIEHLNGRAGQLTTRLAQVVRIGKHELEVVIDPKAFGAKLEDWSSIRSSLQAAGASDRFWLWAAVVALVCAYFSWGS